MNRENAIQCLQVMKGVECINALSAEFPEHYGVENVKAIEMAIKALESMPEYEKLKERDRVKVVKEVHLDEYYCPACGAENGCCDGKVEDNFCPRCGQRIDWMEQEE